MILKRTLLSSAAVVATIAALGYFLARASLPAVTTEIRQEVLIKKVSGYHFGGERVGPAQIKVTAWVEYPFVVVGSYSVPHDLHASYYRTRYLVLPGHRRVLSTHSFTSI
jgi:hypothetical protein